MEFKYFDETDVPDFLQGKKVLGYSQTTDVLRFVSLVYKICTQETGLFFCCADVSYLRGALSFGLTFLVYIIFTQKTGGS